MKWKWWLSLFAFTVGLFSTVEAKPVGPLCFTEDVYDAHWALDFSQLGTHWLVAGHVDFNGFRYPVNGSGSGATAQVYTSLGGDAVWAYINFNSEAYPIPAPNTANIYFYIYYPVQSSEGYYETRYIYPPLFSYLTKVACP